MKIIKHKHTVMGKFDKEEYASIVYQILEDNDNVTHINMNPEEINYATVEVR